MYVLVFFKLKQGMVFNLVKVQRRKGETKLRKLYKRIWIFDSFVITLWITVAVVLLVSLGSSSTAL